MQAIEIAGLTKRYGSRIGVEDINLNVPFGSILGFLGPNGAGKTTTIRVMLGLLKPSAGKARVHNLDCWSQSAMVKAQVGYLPGDLRLYSWLSARAAIALLSRIRRMEISEEANRLVAAFELDPSLPVKRMSRGMRQKLGLVMAMAHRPRVLVLDEPTASLDPLMQARLHHELRRLSTSGTCVFLSSHTLDEVEKLCERVAIIREGRIVADQSIENLRNKAPRSVVLKWSDEPGSNVDSIEKLLEIVERQPRLWRGVLLGSSMELVRWCQGKPVADISIDEPDLSTLFQDFYR